MLVQVEAANGFNKQAWLNILRKCRVHPSVILYCCGNEEPLTESMMDTVEAMASHCHMLAPDALFSPMEALALVDWHMHETDAPVCKEPFPHDPVKLKRLQAFSDVLQPQKHIGIDALESTWQEIEPLAAFYKKPYVSHEVGIIDSYIDLDLEKRYEGTRIGTTLFAGARENLRAAGLLHNAPLYYRNACLWAAAMRKLYVERLRMCRPVAGYDYLGSIDCHWHRTGYSTGILNEFHEYKPGESREDILRYNGENIVMLDAGCRRNITCGERVQLNAFVSIYSGGAVTDGVLAWRLESDGRVYANGQLPASVLASGNMRIGQVDFTAPEVERPLHCVLRVTLSANSLHLENRYDFWVFPKTDTSPGDATVRGDVVVRDSLTEADVLQINEGQNTLVLGSSPFAALPLSFRKMMAGRTVGNTATVVYDHPILRGFPHDGWCDLQFYPLMHDASAVVFDDDMPLPFDPIIEVVSSYKIIFKQAALFEFSIGRGRVVVCTLNLSGDDPAQRALLAGIHRYLRNGNYRPCASLTPDTAAILLSKLNNITLDFDADTGLDGNAKLPSKQ